MKNNMKYKVGDKVKLVGYPRSVCDKAKHYGKIATITRVEEYAPYPYIVNIDGVNLHWCWCDAEFEPVNNYQKIVITTDGKTTLARLYDGKKVIKRAEAKCSPDDEFDFNAGAELAFNRLMGKDKAPSTEWEVVKRKAKKGDYIRLTTTSFSFNEVGDILKVHRIAEGLVKVLNKDLPRGKYGGFADNHEWNYSEHEYEVVKPVVKPCKKETPKPEVYNGKVVCIKTKYPWWTVGKVYEVKGGIIVDNEGCKYPSLGGYRYKNAEDIRHAGCVGSSNYNRNNEFIPFVEED